MGNWQPELRTMETSSTTKYENVEEEVRNLMDKWLSKTCSYDCEQSHNRAAEKN